MDDLVTLRMRLLGGAKTAAEVRAVNKEVAATGPAAAKSAKQTAASSSAAASSIKRIGAAGKTMRTVGGGISKYVTVPLVAATAVSAKFAIDFDDQMSQIATQAGGSTQEVNRMTDSVLAFAASGHSDSGPTELAQALFRIESAGYRGAKAMDALRHAEALSSVGHSDFERTTTVLVAAMRTGIKGTQDLDQAVGILNATVGAGNMRFEDLAGALGTGLLPRAKAAGISLAEVGAMIATMTAQGVPAQAAATRLGMTLSLISAPTTKATKALESMGLSQYQIANTMRTKGLMPALIELKSHLDDLSQNERAQAISDIFGGGRTSSAITLLLGNLGDLDSRLGQINRKAGTFDKALAINDQQPIVKLRTAWAQLQAALVSLGNVLLPVIVPALVTIAGVLERVVVGFDHLPGPAKTVIAIMLGIVAVAGPVLMFFGGMAAAVVSLSEAFAVLGGGAALGGLVGGGGALTALVGLLPEIAIAAGVAVGVYSLGHALMDLFSAGKKVPPMEASLKASSEKLTAAMHAESAASHGLASASHRLHGAHVNARKATRGVERAEQQLLSARRHYGDDSRQAVLAELRLARAKRQNADASRAVTRAERVHGTEATLLKRVLVTSVAAEKQRIIDLKAQRKALLDTARADIARGASSEKLADDQNRLNKNSANYKKVQDDLNRSLQRAGQQIGPKYANWLSRSSFALLSTKDHVAALNDELLTQIKRTAQINSTPIDPPTTGGHGLAVPPPQPSSPNPRRSGSSSRGRVTSPAPAGRIRVPVQERRRGDVHHKPVQFVVDKRVLAEGTVTVQEDDEARS